jgi:hypothetical protein
MKTPHKYIFLLFPFIPLFFLHPVPRAIATQDLVSPTPTYDPLEEPPLPPNPTEYELGRNLYWHWCMTCHGDRGQGLTDEFRGIWEPDHQNCWGRGCHAGHSGDTGFPIPTVVPALVDETHLAAFASVQELSEFLEATHPPQSPGVLKDDEYHAIALFVFALNERPLIEIPSAVPPALQRTGDSISSPEPERRGEPVDVHSIALLGVLATLILIFVLIRRHVGKKIGAVNSAILSSR